MRPTTSQVPNDSPCVSRRRWRQRHWGTTVAAVSQPLEDWVAGPGAALPERARDDLVAMFRTYDREGLVGDPATLGSLLQREPRTWRETLE